MGMSSSAPARMMAFVIAMAALPACGTVDSLRASIARSPGESGGQRASQPATQTHGAPSLNSASTNDDKTCEVDFKQKYATLKQEETKMQQAIADVVKASGPHERFIKLAGLRKNIKDGASPGAAYLLEEALLNEAGSPTGWLLYMTAGVGRDANSHTRALQPYETELAAACEAKGDGVQAARKRLQDSGTIGTLLRQADDKGRERKTIGLLLSEDPLPSESFLATATEFTVTAVKADGASLSIVAEKSRRDQVILGCRESTERWVAENGKVARDRSCSYGSRVSIAEVEFSVAQEANLGLSVGDQVEFVAQVTQTRATSKKVGNEETRRTRLKADAALLVDVRRKGNIVVSVRESIASMRR